MSIALRPYSKEDAQRLSELANNFKIAKFLTGRFPHPYTIDHANTFIETFLKDEPTKVFAITYNNELVGGTGIHLQEDIFINNAEIGYWVGEAYWGKGIMTEALKLITDKAFQSFPITRVYCRVFGNNPRSMKVLEKAGFKLEAKFDRTLLKNGEILDEYIYAKRRDKN